MDFMVERIVRRQLANSMCPFHSSSRQAQNDPCSVVDSAAVQAVEELAREIDNGCDVTRSKHGLQSILIITFSVAVSDRLAKMHRHRPGDTRLKNANGFKILHTM